MIKTPANLIAAIFVLTVCATLQAKDSGCTAADFSGPYSLAMDGQNLSTAPAPGDFTRLGAILADGKGNTSGSSQASYNGNEAIESATGTYQVSDNCHIVWKTGSGGTAYTLEGVLVLGGQKVTMMVTEPAYAVQLAVLEKQRSAVCTNADLSGSYVLTMNGHLDFAVVPTGIYARVGQLAFDGSGVAKVSMIAIYGGAILWEEYSGTYSVDSACHLTWKSVLPWPLSFGIIIEGQISADGTHILVMQTGPAGTAITGDMIKQSSTAPVSKSNPAAAERREVGLRRALSD